MPRQIRFMQFGLWHRPADADNGGSHQAACDEMLTGPFFVKDGPLLLDLCPLCWSELERDRGKLKKYIAELAARSDDERAMWEDEYEITPSTPSDVEWIANDHERKKK